MYTQNIDMYANEYAKRARCQEAGHQHHSTCMRERRERPMVCVVEDSVLDLKDRVYQSVNARRL